MERPSPLLSFAQTDMAFKGDVLVTGNYHGFNIYRLTDAKAPTLLSSVVCPGGQGDVSIVGNLLIMSVEQTRGRVDCGRQGVNEDVSKDRFRGLRIFDISDLTSPQQVGQVQTCRGSHTHSVVFEDKDRIVVYNSGTAGVRKGEELAGCVGGVPGDNRTALFRIDVVEIPKADPSKSRIVDSPAVFADEATGRIAGLWQGGDHGEGTQETSETDQCHDITVFPTRKLAAGACSGNGIIFDISDPLKPKRLDVVTDKGFRLLAFGDLQQRRHQGDLHRRMGRWFAAALPVLRSAQLGRRCDLRHRRQQAGLPWHLQTARCADRD